MFTRYWTEQCPTCAHRKLCICHSNVFPQVLFQTKDKVKLCLEKKESEA